MRIQKRYYRLSDAQRTLLKRVLSYLDSSGQEVERHVYFSSEESDPALKIITTYAAYGRPERVQSFKGENTLKSEIVYVYNNNGELIEKYFKNATGVVLARHLWQMNEKGQLVRYQKFGKDDRLILQKDFFYDEQGNSVRETHSDGSGQIHTYKKRLFDAEGHEILENIFNGDGKLLARKYTFYQSGHIPVEISWYNPQQRIQRLELFAFWENGQKKQETILDFFVNQSFFKNFDRQGKLLNQQHRIGGEPVSEELFEYDAQHFLTRRLKFVYKNGQKQPEEEIIFERIE